MAYAALEPRKSAGSSGTTATALRRLNVNLTEEAFDELEQLAQRTGRSKTDLIRLALGLLRFVFREKEQNHRFAVVSNEGQILKEFVLPI